MASEAKVTRKKSRMGSSRKSTARQRFQLSGGQNWLVIGTQILFFVLGLLFMLAGSLRILLEFGGSAVKDAIASFIGTDTLSLPSLFLIGVMAPLGYYLWWCMAAIGAKEPPAWHAGRNGLLIVLFLLLTSLGLTLWLQPGLILLVAPALAIFGAITLWFLVRFNQEALRLALGAERLKQERIRFFTLRNIGLTIWLSSLTVLGVVYAILTDMIELPLPDTEPNQFLFLTTFDNYNDEWSQEDDNRLAAEVVNSSHLVLTLNSTEPDTRISSVLEHEPPFDYFDLEVTATPLGETLNNDQTFGVLFRHQDRDNYHAFEVDTEGYYRVYRVVQGESEEISTWVAPQQTLTFPTIVRIVADSNPDNPAVTRFWFFLNGQLLRLCQQGANAFSVVDNSTGACISAEWTDYFEEPNATGNIGFLLGNGTTIDNNRPLQIAFDDLTLFTPQEDPRLPRSYEYAGFVLYRNNFDKQDAAAEWQIFETPEGAAQILRKEPANGWLVISVNSQNRGEGQFSLLDRKFRDFDLRVTTTQLQSAPDHANTYGVMFRYRDNENYYRFEISGDGYYQLVKVKDGTTEKISTWIPTTQNPTLPFKPTLIRPGFEMPITTVEDTRNQIRIVAKGDRFWFFVNNQHVQLCQKGENRITTYDEYAYECKSDTLTDFYQDGDFKQGQIAFFAGYASNSALEYPISIAFDNLFVVGPADNPLAEENTADATD